MKTIPKYLVFVIGVLLLFVTACSSKGKIYSEWRFQNRETGEYLYEEDGLCKFGSEKWEKVLCGKSKRLREKKFTSRIKKADVIFLSTVTGLPVSPSRENARIGAVVLRKFRFCYPEKLRMVYDFQ